jgi:hypothetical protein
MRLPYIFEQGLMFCMQGDCVPSSDATRHEEDIPSHRIRDAEPRSRTHLRRRWLPQVSFVLLCLSLSQGPIA